jgi:AcrR family transcriptional regulator
VSVEPLTAEKRRELTRRHLLDAAASEFARHGFHGASLDAVAAAAGFTKGAVYSNFDSKADLFLAVIDDRMERQADLLADQIESAGSSAVHLSQMQETVAGLRVGDEWIALRLEFLLYAARNPEAQEKLADLQRRQRASVEALIAHEYERRGATPSWPIPLLAQVSLALFDGLDLERLIDPDAVSEATETAVLEFLYATVGVPEPTD